MTYLSRRQVLSGSALLLCNPSFTTQAHRQKFTFSEIIWQKSDNRLDITHIYHIHETAQALATHGLIKQADLTRLKARSRLALYTQAHFQLTRPDTHPLPLNLLGAETEGHSVYVYQQAYLQTLPTGFIIDCRLLRSFIPAQINYVDIHIHPNILSLQFMGNDGPKEISF